MNTKSNHKSNLLTIIYSMLTVITLLLSCNKLDKANHQMIECISSPDKAVDAILMRESYGGAIGGFFYSVYIKPHGKDKQVDLKTSSKDRVFYANHVTHISLVWRENRCLEIIYNRATIEFFTNYWIENLYVVETRLKPLNEWSLEKENFFLSQ